MGQYPANPWGFYDMFGNVEEMVFKDLENSNRNYGIMSRHLTKTIVRSDWLKPSPITQNSGRLVLKKVD